MTGRVAGKVALITGAAQGLGEAMARLLVREGARVAVTDINADAARAVAASINVDHPGQAEAWTHDVTDEARWSEVVAEVVARFGGVSVLVNNAGVGGDLIFAEQDTAENWQRQFDINLRSVMFGCKHALPHLRASAPGSIINISSVHGLRASPFKSAYVAAKHALEGLSKTVALEGAPHGVTSNCVNPGYVETDLVRAQIADQARVHDIPEAEVVEKILLTESAIKRMVRPEEIAAMVCWIASENAGMITGASHPIDGGWSAR